MMPSIVQLLVLAAAILILFKSKDIPRLLSEIGSGVRALRRGVRDEERLIEPD